MRPRLTLPELPFDAPKLQTVMSWHNRFDELPEHRWPSETIVVATAGIWTCMDTAMFERSRGVQKLWCCHRFGALSIGARGFSYPDRGRLRLLGILFSTGVLRSLAGLEHGRTIRLAEFSQALISIPSRPLLAASSLRASRRGTLFG
jgi:hypothetical protein